MESYFKMEIYSTSYGFLLAAADVAHTALGQPTQIEATGELTATEAPGAAGFFGGNWTSMTVMYVLFFGAAWFLIIRPQRKRQKTQQDMQAALKVGDNIVTNSGMYGKIVDIGADVYVVEFGTIKGVRIPVAKAEILAVKEPSLT